MAPANARFMPARSQNIEDFMAVGKYAPVSTENTLGMFMTAVSVGI